MVGRERDSDRNGRRGVPAFGPVRFFGLGGPRRAAVLAIVVCALALTIVVPLRTYLSQRTEVTEQVRRAQELRTQVAELRKRKSELSDPEQIQAEARERLRYVMPGETPYMVQLPEDDERVKARQAVPGESWYARLWEQLGEGSR
ncbi:MAG: FtsB family cell division protein [Sciscionella sp.]